ncbi:hypothetical protein SHIRM173S_07529 [Streptomyces hirsutus]
MHAPIAPTWIFPGQAQHQPSDRAHGARLAPALRPGLGGVPDGDEVTAPSSSVSGRTNSRIPRRTFRGRPWSNAARNARSLAWNRTRCPFRLPLQERNLMAQGQDFYILLAAAHRQQPQHRERVRHTQVRQSQQHDRSSCRNHRRPRESAYSGNHWPTPKPAPTCMDEVFDKGRRRAA